MITNKMAYKDYRILIAISTTVGFLFIFCCSSNQLPEESTLLTLRDKEGRVRKTVVTGSIPGEDVFLTITRFDSAGRVVAVYGTKPYGNKYKSTFKYGYSGQIIEEVIYDYSNDPEFEHYTGKIRLYALADTMADFENSKSRRLIVYTDSPKRGLTNELQYQVVIDAAGRESRSLILDTTYNSLERADMRRTQ